MSDTIERKISYTGGSVDVLARGLDFSLPLVKDVVYYDESDGGGEGVQYYLELTKEEYEFFLAARNKEFFRNE